MPTVSQAECVGCGAAVSGRYCWSCGERTEAHDYSLKHFIEEILESTVHVDGRVFASFRLMLTRPGELVNRFHAGKRKTQMGPVQMFIVCNVLYFLFLPLPLRLIIERRRLDPAGESIPSDGYVFGDEIGRRRGAFQTAWEGTLKRAKITALHCHDLRREAGSRWMDAGIPLATIQRWLGHANIAQTSTYLGASLGSDEQDMRVFEERIGRTAPLTQIDLSGGSTGSEPTSPDLPLDEKTQQNTIVH